MADLLDVLSLDEARDAIEQPQSDTDRVAAAVTATSRLLDRLVGPVVRRAVAGEAIEVESCRQSIWLRNWPIVEVTSLTEYDTAGTGTALTVETHDTKPADGYLLARYTGVPDGLYGGRIRRRATGAGSVFGAGTVVASYTAGRYANTAAVDPYFKEPAAVLLVNIYQRALVGKAMAGEYDVPRLPFPGFAVPRFVRQALSDDWQADEITVA